MIQRKNVDIDRADLKIITIAAMEKGVTVKKFIEGIISAQCVKIKAKLKEDL